ncbi:MAG: mandelate racemase/muconate lactonizing enzyme family protein [Gaiellaceae bacterium MAG52_C11]|nr:mandelate racemase/muconate lactonizing enzyme family protein [Candidatus Gaiellasilicea maunaloa]
MMATDTIRRVDVFSVLYHHAGGPFALSGGRSSNEQDATIVRVETGDGLVGWGEQCVFTPSFLPGYGPSTRAVLEPLARAVLGADPHAVELVHARMDAAIRGYAYAKSALDIACWDLHGKATGLRLSDLLGGTRQEQIELYTGVGVAAPEEMRERCADALAAGFRQVQVKVGSGRPDDDVERIRACVDALAGADRVIVDANGYWPQADAVRVVAAVDELDVYIEQPCATVAECARVRRRSRRPFILDEVLTGVREIVEAHVAGALDAVRLKLSNVGGITPTRRARDLAVALGLPLTIEDAGGGDIVSAASMHLACSTDPKLVLGGYLPSEMVVERIAAGAPAASNGMARLPTAPGLGIAVDESALGDRVLRIE